MSRFTRLVALVSLLVLGALYFGLSGAYNAQADTSPPGCSANNLSLDVQRALAPGEIGPPNASVVSPGQEVLYTVSVENHNDTGCDVLDADVTLTLPAADGTATGTVIPLATGVDFPADGSNNTTYPAQSYIVSVNPGVVTITAKATVDSPTGLQDTPEGFPGDLVLINKTVSSTVTEPDLVMEKTPDGGSVVAPGTAAFTIVLTNNGPGVALDIVIDDELPAGHTWVENPDTAECDITGGTTLHCDLGDMAAGDSFAVTVETPVSDPENCDELLPNVATASASNHPSVSDPGDITVLCEPPNLVIDKSPDGATVVAPGTAAFTIVVTNTGPGTARDTVLDDPLPAGYTWTENPDLTECSIAGGALHCDVGDMPAGDSFSVTVETDVTDPADCGAELLNVAVASATNNPPVSDPGDITVNCELPHLVIQKTPDGGSVTAPGTAAFTIVVTNTGPGTATDVVLDDPLPAGHAWTENPELAECSIAGGSLHCDIGDLAAGDSFAVTVETSVSDPEDCGAELLNVATASATNNPPVSDPGGIAVNCESPNLVIEKSPDGGTVVAPGTAAFTIVVSNTGPGTATDVVLDDPLPAGYTWTENPDLAECSIAGGTSLHCDIGDMPAGASFSVTVETSVSDPADCDEQLLNVATASASNNPAVSDPGDITVNCEQPHLVIEKTPDGGTVNAPGTAAFTIGVKSLGPATAVNVVLDDPLPAGHTWTENPDLAECSIVGGALHCDIGDMPAGDSFSVTVETPVSGPSTSSYGSSYSGGCDGGGQWWQTSFSSGQHKNDCGSGSSNNCDSSGGTAWQPTGFSGGDHNKDCGGTDDCGVVLLNTAYAKADNHPTISDDGDITVVCEPPAKPSIHLEKATNGQDADKPTGPYIEVGKSVEWTYVATNTGNVALSDVSVIDDQGVVVTCPKDTLEPGESMTCTASGIAVKGQYANLGTVTGVDDDGTTVTDSDPSHYYGKDNGTEGCTPGYWKQSQHSWAWDGYAPSDSYSDVFGVGPSFGDITLLEALSQGGGGEMALGRQAVAALLNASSAQVDYLYSTDEVIALVQQAYANGTFETVKDLLQTQNEKHCNIGKEPPKDNCDGNNTSWWWGVGSSRYQSDCSSNDCSSHQVSFSLNNTHGSQNDGCSNDNGGSDNNHGTDKNKGNPWTSWSPFGRGGGWFSWRR